MAAPPARSHRPCRTEFSLSEHAVENCRCICLWGPLCFLCFVIIKNLFISLLSGTSDEHPLSEGEQSSDRSSLWIHCPHEMAIEKQWVVDNSKSTFAHKPQTCLAPCGHVDSFADSEMMSRQNRTHVEPPCSLWKPWQILSEWWQTVFDQVKTI